ncbi:MAG: hypothetical protein PHD60_11110, partial [Clostridia bacterium]|nr:hypothetical protein [Clostridia bacterium]
VSTGRNQALFYSGGKRVSTRINDKGFVAAREGAESYATRTSKTTLEMTPGGKWLDDLKLFENPEIELTPKQSMEVWSRLSERYAQQASGAVTAFSKSARPLSIFNTVELPALRSNTNITHINIR